MPSLLKNPEKKFGDQLYQLLPFRYRHKDHSWISVELIDPSGNTVERRLPFIIDSVEYLVISMTTLKNNMSRFLICIIREQRPNGF